MMKHVACHTAFVFALGFSITHCFAANWKINAKESTISFTGTQNNAPVSGKFTGFTGDIEFNPDQLATSKATITVDMNSVSTAYPLVAETLKTEDWFDTKKFPQAVFKSTSVKKTGDKTYQVNGTLTVRDTTLPIVVNFTLNNFTANQAKVTGSTTLKRTAFGIGRGEWSKTTDIKDDVSVQFTLSGTQ